MKIHIGVRADESQNISTAESPTVSCKRMTPFNRLSKYSTLLLLLFTSGLLFFVVGHIENYRTRYKIFDIFQFGTDSIFKVVDLKFHTNKDNTIWVSYYHIAPLVNLLASLIWTGIFLLLFRLFAKPAKSIDNPSTFWRRVLFTNLTLSLLFFAIWLCMDLDFIYSSHNSFIGTFYGWFSFIAFLPAAITDFFASLTLDQGGDTAHGYDDMYLMTKTATSFALTMWSIVGVFIFDRIKMWRTKKLNSTSVVEQNASS